MLLRLAGDQRARRDSRHDSDAEDDDDVKKVRKLSLALQIIHIYLGCQLDLEISGQLKEGIELFEQSIFEGQISQMCVCTCSQRCSHLLLLPPKSAPVEI